MTNRTAKRPNNERESRDTNALNWNGHVVPCIKMSGTDLAQLAESMDELLVYQIGAKPLPASELSRITEPLRALAWPHRSLLSDSRQIRQTLTRQITDRLTHLRLKTGRHVLAGVILQGEGDSERKILLVITAPAQVESCDFELGTRQAA